MKTDEETAVVVVVHVVVDIRWWIEQMHAADDDVDEAVDEVVEVKYFEGNYNA